MTKAKSSCIAVYDLSALSFVRVEGLSYPDTLVLPLTEVHSAQNVSAEIKHLSRMVQAPSTKTQKHSEIMTLCNFKFGSIS